MEYREIEMDLFDLPTNYALAHCISADAEMGVGIAVEFVRRYKHLKESLQEMNLTVGTTIGYYSSENPQVVFNLVTKYNYWDKPTRGNFNKAVMDMKKLCVKHDITYLGLPKLGSGKDRLSWKRSSEWIKEVFKDTDIEIVVCIK